MLLHTDHQLLFCFDLFDFDEVLDLEDHSTNARVVRLLDDVADLAEAEGAAGSRLVLLDGGNGAAHELDLEGLSHR